MRNKPAASAASFLIACVALFVSATPLCADPVVLRWNGASGAAWDSSTANWLDAGNNAVVWQPGAEAQFTGTGGLVNIAGDVTATNLTFTGNGYVLLGAGRLSLEGTLSAVAATTNCLAADLFTAAGLAKTGAGALALTRCTGPLAVQQGSLLVSSSLFADADLAVSAGAALVTLGDPDNAANLLLNPSFEYPALGSGSYAYANSTAISNWTVTVRSDMVARENTTTANAWNAAGASPDGAHMLILQYQGAVAQTVTVATDGLYSLAFSHLLRSGYLENQVYVSLDGLPLASFLNRGVQFAPGRFSSGALWLKAGSHTVTLAGEGGCGDRASMIDAVCLAAPSSANACRALTGDSLLKVASGASVVLSHAGPVTNAYVSIAGAATSGTFTSSHTSGIFSGSGSLVCFAATNVLAFSGSGSWSDASRWLDGAAPSAGGNSNLVLRFPSLADGAAATNDFSGTFLARRVWMGGLAAGASATLAGNAIAFTNSASGTAPKLSFTAPGAATVTAPLVARSALTVESHGSLTVTNAVPGLPTGSILYKSGPGSLTLPTLTNNIASVNVYQGNLVTPSLATNPTPVNLISQAGKSAELTLTKSGQSISAALYLMGSGTCAVHTACGGTITLSNWTYGYGDTVNLFDVAAGDALSLRQILIFYGSSGARISSNSLVKAGAGTLEIRSQGSDSGNNRAYLGTTTLRNGTLTLSEDDCGPLATANPFNGRTYSGYGGSLGASALNNRVRIGDSGTTASDALALIANGNGRWVGHDIEVFNRGATVALGMTTGSVMFANTITLHRDIVLSGPTNGYLFVSNVVAAADFSGSGTTVFSGLAGLRVEGSLPASASLVMGGRALRFGSLTVRAQTLAALQLGSPSTASPGAYDVDFDAGVNDTVAVTASGGLVLSNTVVRLYYAGSGLAFSEPGTYPLFTYTGSLGGDVALLSVGNPQSGASYAFSNDVANSRVTLTVGNTSGGTSYTWKNSGGGAWGAGANWDSGSAPNGAGAIPLFGSAITAPATVALASGYTVGGLGFNNSSYAYTLSGGSLTLDNGASTPAVSVYSGTHTLDTTLSGSSGIAVSTASGALLILSTNAAVNTDLALAQGSVELRGNAALSAAALGASTLLRINATNASLGSLSGQTNAQLALAGTNAKLTLTQSADATFSGYLRGDGGALVKKGSATLTLDAPATVYSGRTDVAAGTLSLKATPLAGAVSVASAATLGVQSSATNGLMGCYYSVTPNTNAFWTLAAMEAHFATLKPDLAAVSSQAGTNFDFTTSGTLFPQPYGAGGSRTTYFESVYRGTITVPEPGLYGFGVQGDDGFVLAVNGQTLVARNYYTASRADGAIRLDAGRYDIVLGYFQITSGYGLQLYVKTPSSPAFALVPNAWLTPYSSAASLSGSGALACAASNALFRVTQTGSNSFAGNFSGPAGSLFAKDGNGVFTIDGAGATDNAFAGDIDVQNGSLRFGGRDRIGDASTVRLRAGATIAFGDQETVGALSGAGSVGLGGYVYFAAFTGDGDSDISTSKTYTHLLDFPANGSAATVNGVAFTDAGFSGSANGYSWGITDGTMPPNGWTNSTYTGVNQLLDDFGYGTTNFTLTLSGLATNTAYETRLYFRNFAGNPRYMTLTFTAGAKAIGNYFFNPDALSTRCWVGCRFVTDSAGTLSIKFASSDLTNTPHVYGLSNERVSGSAGVEQLTLAPAAGRSSRFTGTVGGSGALVKTGTGAQSFSGANTLPTPLSVQQGTVTLEPGASLASGVAIAAGATVEIPFGSVTLGGLAGQGTLSLGNYPTNSGLYFVSFTNDAGTGLSPFKTYTHLLDFGINSAKATVNGVGFEKVGFTGLQFTGGGWTNAPVSGYAGGNAPNVGIAPNQGVYNLVYDMNYATSTGTLVLTGLTIGKRYEVRLYHRPWDINVTRRTTLIFDPDGAGPISDSVTFNPDKTAANYLGYVYTAATNRLLITYQSLTADTYHMYGLSNEESYDTQGNPATLAVTNSATFGGDLTGAGAITKTGAGSLTVTGNSTATGPLTVGAGAFGVANGGTATLGPVTVAADATLFGHGRVGGSVAVVSNGWIMAGTSASCGTLQVGGNLLLAPGARLKFHFTATAGDTFLVGGQLSIPTNGVVVAEALAAGARPPTRTALFTSAQTINGPATLVGWTVQGVDNCSLAYNTDRTVIYLRYPRGTFILVR